MTTIYKMDDSRWGQETWFTFDPSADIETMRDVFGDEFEEDEYINAHEELDLSDASNDDVVEFLFGASQYGYWWDEQIPGVRHEIERRASEDEDMLEELRYWAIKRSRTYIPKNSNIAPSRIGSIELKTVRWETENESQSRHEAGRQLLEIIKNTNCSQLLMDACIGNYWDAVGQR
jgi:hypothetical protein